MVFLFSRTIRDLLSDGPTAAACFLSDFPRVYRVELDGSSMKCRFTPLSVGSHTFIGKKCVVESAGIGCNVRIDDGCVLVRLPTERYCRLADYGVLLDHRL